MFMKHVTRWQIENYGEMVNPSIEDTKTNVLDFKI